MAAIRAYFQYLITILAVTGSAVLAYNDDRCGPIVIDECFAKVQTFLRLTQLPYVTEETQLDNLCHEAIGGYNCSTKLYNYPDCLSAKDKELLPIFVSMAEYMFVMLCGNMRGEKGYLREAYLGYSDCILENKEKMDCCAEEAGIPDLPVLRMLEDSSKSMTTREIQTCCPLSRYLECTSRVASAYCGEEAANMTAEYIRRASGEQTEAVCQKVPGYPHPDPAACPGPFLHCSEWNSASQAIPLHHGSHHMWLLLLLSFWLLWNRMVSH